MRTITITMFSMLIANVLFAQDYKISFTSSGSSSQIDSIHAENLTQGLTALLHGDDTLHLVGTHGINSVPINSDKLSLYPNPCLDKITIEFYNPTSDNISIRFCDEYGREILRHDQFLNKGSRHIEVANLKSGIYMAEVRSSNFFYSAKILSVEKHSGRPTISAKSTDDTPEESVILKSTKSAIQIPYNEGDIILFRSYSGDYCTVTTLSPSSSQNVNFEFMPCKDFDGNNYSVVSIGSQIWMAENLKTTHYLNGVEIPRILDTTMWATTTNGAYSWYDNDSSYKAIYGGLYNWYTVVDTNRLCPSGWHIPSEIEWDSLIEYLGGSLVAGGKMKDINSAYWQLPNSEATNQSGFTALPGGYHWCLGACSLMGANAIWWSSTEKEPFYAWDRWVTYFDGSSGQMGYHKNNGVSVRCLKD